MNRRAYLATISASVSGVALAGCSGRSDSGENNGGNSGGSGTENTSEETATDSSRSTQIQNIEAEWKQLGGDAYNSRYIEKINAPVPSFESVWNREGRSARGFTADPLIYDGILYGDGSDGGKRVSLETGELARQRFLDGPGNLLGFRDNKIVYDQIVFTTDGSTVWESSDVIDDNRPYPFARPVLLDGDLYATTQLDEYKCMRVGLNNGNIVWQTGISEIPNFDLEYITPQLSLGDSILVRGGDDDNNNSFMCLNKDNGSVKWKREQTTSRSYPVCSTDDGVLIHQYVPNNENRYIWLSGDTGEVNWTRPVGDRSVGKWGTDGSMLYTKQSLPEDNGGLIKSYSIKSGNKMWETDISSNRPRGDIFVMPDTVIANKFKFNENEISGIYGMAFDKSNGTKKYEYENGVVVPIEQGLLSYNIINNGDDARVGIELKD